MPRTLSLATLTALLFIFTASAHAQTREGVMGDLLKDITEVETKVVGLAKAMPDAAYAWRPAAGVRSTGEVLADIAGDLSPGAHEPSRSRDRRRFPNKPMRQAGGSHFLTC